MKQRSSLNVGFLNVCSLTRKVHEVAQLVSSRGIHLMALAETWLNDSISSGEVELPHFRLHRRDRVSDHRGGGVAVYCHESVPAVRRQDLEHPNIELLWLEIHQQKQRVMVGCFYRPPRLTVESWQYLENCILLAQGCSDGLVLLGDFNVNVLDPQDHHLHHLLSLTDRFSLTNYVTSPTRVTSTSATAIDLLLSTEAVQGPCEILKTDISDHFVILGHLLYSGNAQGSGGIYQSRNMAKIDWEVMNRKLELALHGFSPSENINESVERWHELVLSVLNDQAPLKSRNRRPARPCPWLTTDLQTLVRERNSLHHKLCQQPQDNELRQKHKAARRAARKLDRRLKNEYFQKMCASGSSKMIWRALNTVSGRKRTSQAPNASLEALSSTFGSVVSDPHRPSSLSPPSGPPPRSSLSTFPSVTVDTTAKLMLAIEPTKATGSDQLPGILLKKCAQVLAPSLTSLFNLSLHSGEVPILYKISHISPLFKAGDSTQPGNYRPVSLLPIVSRLLEKCVKQHLVSYLTDHNLLPSTQFAYRHQHSTEDALVLAHNRWQLARHARETTGIVLIDMSKAFDRVRHNVLVEVLFSMGVHGTVLKWIMDYLSERVQRVKHGQQLSKPVACTRGVPQGSVLGPLLFILYTHDLIRILPDGVCHLEFADDILLDYSGSNESVIGATLSSAVTRVAAWLDSIGLLLNTRKTQVMFVSPRGKSLSDCKVHCGKDELKVVKTAKYLGLYIDDDLGWTTHLSVVSRKVTQMAGALWRNGKGLTLKARRIWLLALVRSQLTYASNAFYPGLRKSEKDKLSRLFKYGVRTVFRVHPPTSSGPLLLSLSLPPLDITLRNKIALFAFRCLHGLSSTQFQGLFTRVAEIPQAECRRTTRGADSNLLVIPFLMGPAGRSTISFVASVIWNELPPLVRSLHTKDAFTAALKRYYQVNL